MSTRLAKKVLLIGWDAADWQVINPLLDAGKMPFLEMLINDGVMGNMATLEPCPSPILWTSIATEKRADQHGVLGFVEPHPEGKGIRPVSNTSRKVKALWNICTQQGIKSNVVGWWPSHPAEPRLNRLHNQIGAEYLKQSCWADTERAFRKALAIDGESAVVHDGLAQNYLGQKRYDEAFSAVGIIHKSPEARFQLGLALAKGRRDGRARLAFRTCLSMRPGHQEAREWLERVKPIATPHEAARLME